VKDPILDELHRTRERLLEESGGTLASLVSKLQRDQAASKHVLRDTRRTKDCTEADGQPQSDGSSVSSAQ
jgi:hypothetical protein